jgi:hypothetical protein
VERHVRLLAILSTLWGALAMLVGVSMLLLLVGALAIVAGPEGEAVALAAGLTAAVFAGVFPFGTALGGYGLWILLTDEGRRLFEAPHP